MIVVCLFVVLPITAYAVGGNGGGSSSGSATQGGTSVDVKTEMQGYRFTLVNTQTGEKVGNTVDIFRTNPSGVADAYWFTGSAVEDWRKVDTSNYKIFTYDFIKPWLEKYVTGEANIPWWFVKNGAEYGGETHSLKKWLLDSQAIENIRNLGSAASALEEVSNVVKSGGRISETGFDKKVEDATSAFKNEYGPGTSNARFWAGYYFITQELLSTAKTLANYDDMGEAYYISKIDSAVESITKHFQESRPTQGDSSYDAWSAEYEAELAKLQAEKEKASKSNVINAGSQTISYNSILDPFVLNAYASQPPLPNESGGSNSSRNRGPGWAAETVLGNKGSGDGSEGTEVSVDASTFGYISALIAVGAEDITKDKGLFIDEPALTTVERLYTNELSLIVEPVIWLTPQKNGKRFPSRILGTTRNWAEFATETKFNNCGIWSDAGMGTMRTTNICLMSNMGLEGAEDDMAGSQYRAPVTCNKVNATYQAGVPDNTKVAFSTAYAEALAGHGIGMHIYGLTVGEPIYTTKTEIPDIPTPKKSSDFTVVKMYRTFTFNSSGGLDCVPVAYYQVKNAPRTVKIDDETDYGWKLVEWYTTPTPSSIQDGKTPETYEWNKVKGGNQTGTYSGTDPTTITVKDTDPDKVLYILLESQPTPKDNSDKITVIRVYDNEDGDPDKIITEQIDPDPNTPYMVPEDPDYEYVETKISPNPPNPVEKWDDSDGPSYGNPPDVRYPDTTKTIYIHYIKKKAPDTNKIVLYENELSYNYDLRDLLKDRKLLKIYEYVPAPEVDYGPCTGPHHDRCSHGSPNHYCNPYTCSDDDYTLTDNTYSFTVADSFDQNTLPFIKQWTYTSKMSASGLSPKEGGGGERYPVTPQATFLLIRDKQKDVVTLYPGKNDSIKGEISDLGLSESYTSTDTRYKNKRETTKTEKFFDTVYTKLYYSDREDELAWLSWMSPKRHSRPGTYNTEPQIGHTPDDANAAYSKTDNVEIRYFLGQAGKSEEEPKDTRSAWSKKFKYNTAYSRVSAGLSFYPYLKYEYYRKDSSSPEPVMVTSSNLSELKVYNAIQTGVYKKNEININLDSTQWSTHARSMAFLKNAGISDKKSVLPGGAIQNLDSGHKGDTQIGLTIWQTCLPDTQVQAVQEGFKVSETEAKEATNNLIESVKKAISGYGLVQWGQQGVYGDMKELMEVAEELHENKGISFVAGRGGKTSADDKYYLRHDGDGSNRANFDCLDSRIENQYLYTIYSDVDGNVWVTKDGAELARISKTENADKLLSNAELKLLDDNTKLITNYTAVIQRNSGTTRHGDKWHNEAFDGVSVLMTDVSFDVGYGGDAAKRTNVLDPLLTAPTQSKSDLYNFTEDLVRSSVYVTTKTSSQAEDTSKEGFLGILKGVSGMPDLETGLTDIQSMCYTKNFYIPNATVSDLN